MGTEAGAAVHVRRPRTLSHLFLVLAALQASIALITFGAGTSVPWISAAGATVALLAAIAMRRHRVCLDEHGVRFRILRERVHRWEDVEEVAIAPAGSRRASSIRVRDVRLPIPIHQRGLELTGGDPRAFARAKAAAHRIPVTRR